jgi:renalase
MSTVAVIGAGLAGLVVARELAHTQDVIVFEKSRGVGGRMATRRTDSFQFDHGAQFFTAKTNAFQAFLRPLVSAGIVADWPARFAELDRNRVATGRRWGDDYPHYVGVPAMNAVGKQLASGLNIRLETAVCSLSRVGDRWRLFGDRQQRLGDFDWVIVTAPAAQAADLLASTPIASAAANVHMHACYALLLGFDQPADLPWQAAAVRNADISWISVDSSKPGRPAPFSLVVHSTNAWANAHVDDDRDAVQRHLVDEFCKITGINVAVASLVDVHRWLYANVDRQNGDLYALDAEHRVAACGDWFVRGRIEGAFTSASALAGRIRLEAA